MERITTEGYGSRRLVASYGCYAEAQGAVDRLADEGFPVERLSIVAESLRFEERATGRLNYDKAALGGAVSGALAGALLGFAFGLYGPVVPLVSGLVMALWGLLFGALVGAVGAAFGLVCHALSGGRRDLSSVGGMRADSYDVVADEEVAEDAARRLSGQS